MPLGGIMGKIIDNSFINIRILNESRGPAVLAIRAQADKVLYRSLMTMTLESQPNLDVRQAIVTQLLVEKGAVHGVRTKQAAYRIHGASCDFGHWHLHARACW
jgi:tRNA uridine 5-carboxymethylaminomethyl modification enzyme